MIYNVHINFLFIKLFFTYWSLVLAYFVASFSENNIRILYTTKMASTDIKTALQTLWREKLDIVDLRKEYPYVLGSQKFIGKFYKHF